MIGALERFAAKAIRLGAELLEVEYKDCYVEILAAQGAFGVGIGRLRSSSQDAANLREELHRCSRRNRSRGMSGRS